MVDAVSLAASITAFITIAAQLSKAAATLYNTIHDAPDDIQRVYIRIRDLKFTLDAIDRIRRKLPKYDDNLQIRDFWDEKFEKLQRDFSDYKQFTDALKTGVKGRVRWLLSHEDRAKKILSLLSEDIKVLKTIYRLMVEL
jgi:hypothetical protein